MPKPPETTDPAQWQRFFAMSANNAAWALAEQPPAQADTGALLDAAHAAAWHWSAVGTELHRMRATMLLAQAHAMAGLGASAWRYAETLRAYFLAQADTPDWELAFTHAIHAHAAHASGQGEAHASSHAEAERAIAAIADEEDRAIVMRVFAHVPRP